MLSHFTLKLIGHKLHVFCNRSLLPFFPVWGGRVVRWCWINFQCRGVLLILIVVGQGPTALAVGAGGVVWTFFFSRLSFRLSFRFSFSLSFWETARYRLKYCLKGPLSPKPTNQIFPVICFVLLVPFLARHMVYLRPLVDFSQAPFFHRLTTLHLGTTAIMFPVY